MKQTLTNERLVAEKWLVCQQREHTSADVVKEAKGFPMHRRADAWAKKLDKNMSVADVTNFLEFRGAQNDVSHNNLRWKDPSMVGEHLTDLDTNTRLSASMLEFLGPLSKAVTFFKVKWYPDPA